MQIYFFLNISFLIYYFLKINVQQINVNSDKNKLFKKIKNLHNCMMYVLSDILLIFVFDEHDTFCFTKMIKASTIDLILCFIK